MDERIVMVDSGTGLAITERQLDERSAAASILLRRRGVRPGDTVLICLSVGPDLLVATDAVIAVGGIACPVPPELDEAGLRERIRGSSARIMITDLRAAVRAAEESRVRMVLGAADLRRPGDALRQSGRSEPRTSGNWPCV
jgi:acyl-coenzyme A synthetase/AMP-(fatty) acid ligase